MISHEIHSKPSRARYFRNGMAKAAPAECGDLNPAPTTFYFFCLGGGAANTMNLFKSVQCQSSKTKNMRRTWFETYDYSINPLGDNDANMASAHPLWPWRRALFRPYETLSPTHAGPYSPEGPSTLFFGWLVGGFNFVGFKHLLTSCTILRANGDLVLAPWSKSTNNSNNPKPGG